MNKNSNNKLVVFDLDGTITFVNTFYVFLLFCIICSICVFRLDFVLKIIKAIILRIRKRYNHLQLKIHCIEIWNKLPQKNKNDALARFIVTFCLRKSILKKINYHIEMHVTLLLATAAPEFYARLIATYLNFEGCIGSFYQNDCWIECSSDVKKTNTINYLEHHSFSQISVFYTDHSDDIPLMIISDKVVLVKPKKKELEKIRNCTIECEIL